MTPTETGLYGPGDYPADFVTIDMLWSRDPQAVRRNTAKWHSPA